MRIGVIKVADFLNPAKENTDFANRELYESNSFPPLAWHSYAAITNGFVHIYHHKGDNQIMYDCDMAIVTVDKYLEPLEQIIKNLQSKHIPVVLSFHEGYQTIHRMPLQSRDFDYFNTVRDIIDRTNIKAWINPMPPQMTPFLEYYAQVCKEPFRIFNIPSAWPIHKSSEYITPTQDRKGIIISTSDIGNYTLRNTILSLIIASNISRKTDTTTTIILDNKIIQQEFYKIYSKWFPQDSLIVLPGKTSYDSWLRLLSKHRVAINMDMSLAQGQAVGDCAMVNIPSVGGNTTIQMLIYKHLASDTTSMNNIFRKIKALLTNDKYYEAECKAIGVNALQHISFKAVGKDLKRMYDTIKG